jgi:hypothetical protein
MGVDVGEDTRVPVEGAVNVESTAEPPRRPFWVVGMALLAAVLAVLVGSYLMGARLRPRIGTDPAPTAPAVAAPTAAPTAVAGAATPQPSSAPTPSGLPPGIGVASSPTERAVGEAHERYLRIYSEAVLNLDTAHLHEVLAGEALQSVTDEVNDLKRQGRPVRINESDRLVALTDVTETSALLMEVFTSRSVYVNPATGQPYPRTGPPERISQSYTFQKVDGVWKIVDWSQQSLGEARQ